MAGVGVAACDGVKAPGPWTLMGNAGVEPEEFVGTLDDAPLACRTNEHPALWLVPGGPAGRDTPVLLAGAAEDHRATSGVIGGVVAGGGTPASGNVVGDHFDAVLGGDDNVAGDGGASLDDQACSVVRGGRGGAVAAYASGAAGESSWVYGSYASVLGGLANRAWSFGTIVAGGGQNEASGQYATVLGGASNLAYLAAGSAIDGGNGNLAGADGALGFVLGGRENEVDGLGSTIGGGSGNVAAVAAYAAVRGGTENAVDSLTGAAHDGSTISGGEGNGVGYSSKEAVGYAAIGGGYRSSVYAPAGVVAGGRQNHSGGWATTVGGGEDNLAYAEAAAVGGGHGAWAETPYSVVLGGMTNYAVWHEHHPGEFTVVAGGRYNAIPGGAIFAAGHKVREYDEKRIHGGCFLWRDSGPATPEDTFGCIAENAFRARAVGGFALYTDDSGTAGVRLDPGEGDWRPILDRTALLDVTPVDDGAVAERLARAPVSRWTYAGDPGAVPHVGPMAQDFHAAFGLGTDDRTIGSLDADGVTLAAIRGLLQEVQAMERTVKERRTARDGHERSPALAGIVGVEESGGASAVLGWLALGALAGFVAGRPRRRVAAVIAGSGRRIACGLRRAVVLGLALGVAWLAPRPAVAQFWVTTGNSGTDPAYNYLGTSDDAPLVFRVNDTRALRLEPGGAAGAGTPNVVGGSEYNYVTDGIEGAAVAGGGAKEEGNIVFSSFGFVGGGAGNTAGGGVEGDYASVCGGRSNVAAGNHAAICGGEANEATGGHASVAGGAYNVASAESAVVVGGWGNLATVDYASVCGGYSNSSQGAYATVGGGAGNHATADYAAVGGGSGNWAVGVGSVVAGGSTNRAEGEHGTVGGGYTNIAGADGATVGGGAENSAAGLYATVGGGYQCKAAGDYSTVAGGDRNEAQDLGSTVGGGSQNIAQGEYATVAGGLMNVTNNAGATVSGGLENQALGPYSTVPGGSGNVARGPYSFAAGRRAHAEQEGCFVWGDSTDETVACTAPNQFVARATGGFYLYTKPDLSTGVWIGPGESDWHRLSDRASKRDVEPVDGEEVLARLAEVPIYTWRYAGQQGGARHMGPMAQDFHAAFGLGADDRTIGSLDADGVALAALQALERRIAALRVELRALGPASTGDPGRSRAAAGRGVRGPAGGNLWAWLCGLGLVGGVVVRRVTDRRRSGNPSRRV